MNRPSQGGFRHVPGWKSRSSRACPVVAWHAVKYDASLDMSTLSLDVTGTGYLSSDDFFDCIKAAIEDYAQQMEFEYIHEQLYKDIDEINGLRKIFSDDVYFVVYDKFNKPIVAVEYRRLRVIVTYKASTKEVFPFERDFKGSRSLVKFPARTDHLRWFESREDLPSEAGFSELGSS